ncbi:UDP-N-acetylmuramoyl-tripeptide--D-alanyl-D-alanine ligase [Acetobacter nitrogenifigens DSM 23921 = NBRC 105050]|uniref:UDP-N-acetylmuramoyl-tripeptide--D-alanyl-D-alanine ligase n=1 Tax=Acetobacter nitrogenifigens DSM 23921 = NBRC 105050 TaxID=1120919 RepID=A0A511X835_9PROT|nr:UDP-N-acetylmuramoyl-tripeptide--D-alanyl-D-alanine ligase [Acetobacter nitrogenifigens]GBQ89242.1 UDP-N-acetylmuramoyl-tripeptide--D-alanyl-D-alanine ligase [Acetobacter nitrogenifigens DSM 23921 = NBRC 105050]GEN59098.1 UDP-N-acetylmuramoyl-tripeptide--D-alanyl-D-alanine ligase [Acetobacter nitrogenifigens DSM 23921 = NBRC 105050]
MSALWTAPELVEATTGSFPDADKVRDIVVTGVSIDTRTLVPGDLFIALVGETSDGHQHIRAALEKGASAVLAHGDVAGLADDPRVLRVADTMTALWDLGRHARARFVGKVAAVTGSVGKTTTKEMLRVALSALGPTHAAVASYNNHWGVPLTLARLPRDAAFCVIEIGMNHPGEIAPLAALARPDTAAITTIGSAHVGHMGGLDAIAREKAALIAALRPGSIAVVPDDAAGQDIFDEVARAADVSLWRSGLLEKSEAQISSFTTTSVSGSFMAHIAGVGTPVTLHAPGLHLARNALTALAVVATLFVDDRAKTRQALSTVAQALAAFSPGAGRGALTTIMAGRVTLLDESYNASVLAIRAALDVLALAPADRRVAVLGDMRELGAFASAEHLSLVDPVIACADLVFCCGPHMKELFDALPSSLQGAWRADSDTLAPIVRAALHSGDAVLVKGSLGTRMRVIVETLRAAETV